MKSAAQRDKVALMLAEKRLSNREIAKECGISPRTLYQWQKQPALQRLGRFHDSGFGSADARPRIPSQEPKILMTGICNRTVTTALREACGKGSLDALKKLKPDPRLDSLSELLEAAAVSDSKELIDYLLHLGAQPNDKPNGGSSALDCCLWTFQVLSISRFCRKYPLGS